jgi:hypothetical protein
MLEEKENILRLPIKKSQISLFIYFQIIIILPKKGLKSLRRGNFLYYYFIIINVGIRVSLRVPRLIL